MNAREDSSAIVGRQLLPAPAWASGTCDADDAAQYMAWLERLARLIPGIQRCAILLGPAQGPLSSVAIRPRQASFTDLGGLQALALSSGQAQCSELAGASGTRLAFAQPLMLEQRPRGVLLVVVSGEGGASGLQALAERIQWGAGWLAALLAQAELRAALQLLERSRLLHELGQACLASADFEQAALSASNMLARVFEAQLAQLGWIEGMSARVLARSNTAWHEARSQLVNLAAQAMNEAHDQRATLHWSSRDGDADQGLLAHRAYARAAETQALLSVPLRDAEEGIVGLLLLERDQPFTTKELELAEAFALLLAPALLAKQAATRSLREHAAGSLRAALARLGDGSRPGLKLLAAALCLGLLLLTFVPATYRVSATAELEGEVQRVIAAPFQGYIKEAWVRPGDVVREGQALASLEDRELQLERVRWQSELEVAERKAREAMAAANRVDLSLATAQAGQARAQLELVQERLARARLTAPFDGVITKGDLSQQLGSPVEPGKVLFELAPLSSWRLMIQVDERDIAHLRPGQSGELRLPGLPDERLALHVMKVTAVASAKEGRNFFRVEAQLDRDDGHLRPGMEGVAKVEVGRRSLLWIWTHRLLDWLRLSLWELMP